MNRAADPDAVEETVRWIWLSIGVLFAAAAAVLVASFWLSTAYAPAWNVVSWVFGIPAGAVLGILSSPLGPQDKKRLRAARQVVSGFFSGIVLSNGDRLIKLLTAPRIVSGPSIVVPVVLLATAGLCTALSVFLARSYVFTEE